jgi:hypothetical protein
MHLRFISSTSCFLWSACALAGAEPAPNAGSPVTFNHDIAPIVYHNCMTCHRPGEVGPFSLTTYGEVKKKAKTILKVLDDGYMPPWHAASHGEFLNERKLTDDQKSIFHAWVDAGEPQGAASELPAIPHFTEGWQLGEPDLVLDPGEDYPLAAEGRDEYRCFVLPTHNATDRWVGAVEVRAGNRSVVHHALVFLDTSGKARELDAADPGPGYASFGGVGFNPAGGLGGWAPGITPRPLPDGIGYLLPAGADIVLQVHYHRSGKPESDRTKIGIYYSRAPVDKRYRSFPVSYRQIHIAPGDANYQVQINGPVPRDLTILSITPHMHLLGREMKVDATLPDGGNQPLVNVTDWDFNWQTTYWFKQPVRLASGSSVHLTARYDNSAGNPNNPSNPARAVNYGEQTTNEMCLAFLGFTLDSEHLLKTTAAPTASLAP